MDYTTLLFVGLILLFASTTQGLSGFGFQLISVPLLVLVIGIKDAVVLAALCGYVVNIYLIIALRQHLKFFTLKRLILGALFGVPLGAYFLAKANSLLLEHILGIVIFLFVFFSFVKIIKPTGISDNWGYLFGLISGLLGGAFNTNGPPVVIYFYLQGIEKERLKASIAGYFLFTLSLIVISHFVAGIGSKHVYVMFLEAFPIVLLGAFLGNKLFKRIPTELYNKVILFLLGLISISLILR
jgi:uncharacterized membrane protein YfcA